MPPELAEILGIAGAAMDPAARERADARREELTAGPVELIRLTELGTRAVRQRLLEHLLVLSENLLQLVGLAGASGSAEEVLRAQGPQVRDAVAAALDSAHPDRAGLDELRQLAARALGARGARLGIARKTRRPSGKSGRKRRR